MADWCTPNRGLNLGWFLSLGIVLYFLSPASVAHGTKQITTMETQLLNLRDGAYQFCTQPDPQDWRDGLGTCLNVAKQGTTLDGYYGYPHSSAYVCLRGQVSGNWLQGQGLVISWPGYLWPEIPPEEFSWDSPEGRLSLSQGKWVQGDDGEDDSVSWIIFETARLDMQAMYLYNRPRMTSPAQLCDWPLN